MHATPHIRKKRKEPLDFHTPGWCHHKSHMGLNAEASAEEEREGAAGDSYLASAREEFSVVCLLEVNKQ